MRHEKECLPTPSYVQAITVSCISRKAISLATKKIIVLRDSTLLIPFSFPVLIRFLDDYYSQFGGRAEKALPLAGVNSSSQDLHDYQDLAAIVGR
jgi:hypothetical protein